MDYLPIGDQHLRLAYRGREIYFTFSKVSKAHGFLHDWGDFAYLIFWSRRVERKVFGRFAKRAKFFGRVIIRSKNITPRFVMKLPLLPE